MLVDNPLKIGAPEMVPGFRGDGVMNSVPLFLSLPGPRGHQAATVSLNTEQMLDGIKRGMVKDALEAAVKILRAWDFRPAVITYSAMMSVAVNFFEPPPAATITQSLRSCARRSHLPLRAKHKKGEGVAARYRRSRLELRRMGERQIKNPRLAARGSLDAWGPMGRGIPWALRPKICTARYNGIAPIKESYRKTSRMKAPL
jgi:hypothetical protein